MENFATDRIETLLVELKSHRLDEETTLKEKIGITRQFIRDNIDGINKAIKIIETALTQLRDM